MDYTFEAYLSYIPNDEISTEGFAEGLKRAGKAIWQALKALLRKIIVWFQNLLLNINYFKNAKLDEQMSKDLIYMLKLMNPRTLVGSVVLPKIYRVMMTFKSANFEKDEWISKSGDIDSRYGTIIPVELDNSIKKVFETLSESKDAVENSDQYKRYKANEYKHEKVVDIPLTHIIPDMKESRKSCVDCENQLNAFEQKAEWMDENNKLKAVCQKVIHLLRSLISYYNFRISLLSEFFNAAKASLQGTIGNVKASNSSEYDTRGNKTDGRVKYTVSMKVVADGKEFKELCNKAKEANDEANWDDYKKYFGEIAKTLKVGDNSPILIRSIDGNQVNYTSYKNSTRTIPVQGKTLYHIQMGDTTKLFSNQIEEFKELKPNAVGNKGGYGSMFFYPNPRVYAHIGYPSDVGGRRINAYTEARSNLYMITDSISEVYNDTEMGKTACYIETTKPLKVKKIDLSEFKKAMDIKINADSVEFNKNKN